MRASKLNPAWQVVLFIVTLFALLTLSIAVPQRSAIALRDDVQPPNISWQLHSWDDLDEWIAGLRKGARYIKVDVNFNNASFCVSQAKYDNDPRGCFVLTHDNPTTTRQYNTTHDIASLLANPDLFSFTKQEEKLYIALCFKTSVDPCASEDWLSLTDDLVEMFNNLVAENDLNVEFVLDGSGTAGGNRMCLAQRWRPWNMTYISLYDSPNAMYSMNTTLGYDRMLWLDEPVPDVGPTVFVAEMRAVNYAKFQALDIPFLVWEPSDQDQILEVCDEYLKGPTHPAGFRFAINIDPVMFEVFAAAASGYGWNVEMAYNATQPLIESFLLSSQPLVAFIAITLSSTQQLQYSVFVSDTVLGQLKPVGGGPILLPTASHAIEVTQVCSFMEYAGAFFLGDETGRYIVYHFDEATMQLVPASGGRFTSSDDHHVFDSFIFSLPQQDEGPFVLSAQVSSGGERTVLEVQLYDIALQEVVNTQFGSDLVHGFEQISDVSIAINTDPSTQPNAVCASSQTEGILVYGTNRKQIYGTLLCIDHATRAISLVEPSYSSSPVRLPIGVGSKPSISIQGNYVMELHGDGYCDNSHYFNTRNAPAVCNAPLSSLHFLLNYNYGLYADFVQRILDNKPANADQQFLINSCDDKILHGSYDRGANPDVELFVDSNGNLGVVAIHEGVPTSMAPLQTEGCGAAIPYDGIILDSWNLPLLN